MNPNKFDLNELTKETVKRFANRPEDWSLPIPKDKVLMDWCKHFNVDTKDMKDVRAVWLHMNLCLQLHPSFYKPLDKPYKEWACKEYGI